MGNSKSFIITIDTEADNQWDNKKSITTENAKYLPRFQELCEIYGYKPVWLTNYEMANDDLFVDYMGDKQKKGMCEIGMHLHAWYTPPNVYIDRVNDNREYLIEYPDEIMDKKILTMTDLIESKFGVRPISHRAGRWAMDDRYFRLLAKHGYRVDCSVTPGLDWSNHLGATGVGGADYSIYPTNPYITNEGILEVPLSVRNIKYVDFKMIKSFRGALSEIKKAMFGRTQWLRQDNVYSVYGNKILIDKIKNEQTDYLMFMIHSSELMAGENPTFRNNDDIEILYSFLKELFEKIKNLGYEGKTLREYYELYHKK